MPAKICNHRRPEDGARCVLNEHPDNPHHGYAYRVNPVIPAMEALIERFQRADNTLSRLAATAHTLHSKTRYEAKAEGVRLARSYAEEALREVRRG